MEDWNKSQEEVEAYLAMIRKTIADSERLVSQAELRIAETDRMLEQQGLTREQVLGMQFSDAQLAAANAELERRGLAPMATGAGEETPAIWADYERIVEENNGKTDISQIARFAFYERARNAYAVVATGETAIYANIILKKGVVK